MLASMLFFAAVGFLVREMDGAALGVIAGGVLALLWRFTWFMWEDYVATRHVNPCKWHESGHWSTESSQWCPWLWVWTYGGIGLGILVSMAVGGERVWVRWVALGLGGLLPHAFYRLRRRMQADRLTAKGDIFTSALIAGVALAVTGCATGTATDRVAKYCRPYPPAESNILITMENGAKYNVPPGPLFARSLTEQRCFEAAIELSSKTAPPGTGGKPLPKSPPWPESPWVCQDGTRQCAPEERTRLLDK